MNRVTVMYTGIFDLFLATLITNLSISSFQAALISWASLLFNFVPAAGSLAGK